MISKLSKIGIICLLVFTIAFAATEYADSFNALAKDEQPELLCVIGEYTFGSDGSSDPEFHEIVIPEHCTQPGLNTLLLENINPPDTNHWIIWDSLSLTDVLGNPIWVLGQDEGPPDYTDVAFDEFDTIEPWNTHFDVRTMEENEFPFNLNDGEMRQVEITFELTKEESESSLTLRLDTLYATHDDVPSFTLRVKNSGIPAPIRSCTVGEYTFGSGTSTLSETHDIVIDADCIQPGHNTILLEAMDPANTNHWLIWDYLALVDQAGNPIWSIGQDEAPPDYSGNAFNEFDSTAPLNAHFDRQTMSDREFPYQINDGNFSQIEITFELSAEAAQTNVTLRLDTLYATHDDIPSFILRVQTNCDLGQCVQDPPPTPVTPEPTDPCITDEYTFGSGTSTLSETHDIVIDADCIRPGRNTILLEAMDPANTNHWLIWDYLALMDQVGNLIWSIGQDEAPPDYSGNAFNEFDSTTPLNPHFDRQTMSDKEFPYQINDGNFSQIEITFELSSEEAQNDVMLRLDTLYASHDDVLSFTLRVQTNCTIVPCGLGTTPVPTATPVPGVTPIPTPTAKSLLLIYGVLDNNLNDGWDRLINNVENGMHDGVDVRIMIDAFGEDNAYVYKPMYDDNPFCPTLIGENYTCDGRYVENENFWRFSTEDTAHPSSLYRFIVDSLNAYPNASSISLVLIGHGAGWGANLLPGQPSFWQGQADEQGGLLWDDTPGVQGDTSHSLSTRSLGLALLWATARTSHTIDLLYLDGCSLGATEVAYEIRHSAKFLLASPNLSWLSLNYDALLAVVNNQLTPQEIGERWLQLESEELRQNAGHPFTFALVALQKLDALAAATSELGATLIGNDEGRFVKNLDETVEHFDSNFDGALDENDSYIDLLSVAASLLDNPTFSKETQFAAQQVVSTLNDAVVAKEFEGGTPWLYPDQAWNWRQFGGLSIYLPMGEQDELRRRFYQGKNLAWATDTMWDEFLDSLWPDDVLAVNASSEPDSPVCKKTTDKCKGLSLPLQFKDESSVVEQENRIFLPIIQK